MTGIYAGLFAMNFMSIPEYIRTGNLDLLITKPVSLQFIVTLRHIDFGLAIPDIIAGIIMIICGWGKLGIPLSAYNILGFCAFAISGIIILYSLFLLPRLLAFFIVNTSSINEVTESFWEFNNMPMLIYSKWVQNIGIFVLPVFLISNFSPLFILNRLNGVYIIWGIVAPLILFAIVRVLWKFSIKNYSSASS